MNTVASLEMASSRAEAAPKLKTLVSARKNLREVGRWRAGTRIRVIDGYFSGDGLVRGAGRAEIEHARFVAEGFNDAGIIAKQLPVFDEVAQSIAIRIEVRVSGIDCAQNRGMKQFVNIVDVITIVIEGLIERHFADDVKPGDDGESAYRIGQLGLPTLPEPHVHGRHNVRDAVATKERVVRVRIGIELHAGMAIRIKRKAGDAERLGVKLSQSEFNHRHYRACSQAKRAMFILFQHYHPTGRAPLPQQGNARSNIAPATKASVFGRAEPRLFGHRFKERSKI